jgi:hypothetical protein
MSLNGTFPRAARMFRTVVGAAVLGALGSMTATSAPATASDGFVFPYQNPSIAVAPSQWSQDMGVDIAGLGHACGASAVIVATDPGTVVQEGMSGFGPDAPVILVSSGPRAGRYVYYGHTLGDLVAVGTTVAAGQPITHIGCGDVGESTGPHLEIGISTSGCSSFCPPAYGQTSQEMYDLLIASYSGSSGTPLPATGPGQPVDASEARFTPVVVGGLVHAYKRSPNGDLFEFVADHLSGRVWNAYDVSAAATGPVLAGEAVPVAVGGIVHVYGRAVGGDLVEFVSDHLNGRVWNAYDLTADAGGPALAGDAFPVSLGGNVHVYSRATGGHLIEFVNDQQSDRVWNAYDLSADGDGPALAGDPTAVVSGPLVHVYTRALGGHLVEFIADHQSGLIWNAYDLTADAAGPALGGDPAAVVLGSTVHVYATATGGDLVEFVSDHQSGRVWNVYDLSADAAGPPLLGAPAPVVGADGVVHVYGRGGDGHVMEFIADHQSGRIWNAYDLSADAAGPPVTGDPAPIVIGSFAHVYVTAAGGDLAEFVSDQLNGRVWNAYDLTVSAAGPLVVP